MVRSLENEAKYKQLKLSLKPEIVSAFKKVCANTGISMASAISQFMADYSKITVTEKNTEPGAPDYSTRRKRRAAVGKIAKQLEQVRDKEQAYCDRIPENLQSSVVYERAEEFISNLDTAIDALVSAE
jgi:hypothetical protein